MFLFWLFGAIFIGLILLIGGAALLLICRLLKLTGRKPLDMDGSEVKWRSTY